MKILITGGCGFLGSNLAHSYLKEDHDIFIIDSLFRKGSKENYEWLKSNFSCNRLKFFIFDLVDKSNLNKIFNENGPFDYIIHVAGQVAMTSSIKEPLRDLNTNIIGTFNLLESCRKFSPNSLFAYSSTNKVYGDLENLVYEEHSTRYTLKDYPNGLNENLNLDFSTPYGCSKGSADQYVRDWSRVYGLNTVVFRHSSIYGGRQFASYDQGWIGWFCQQALKQKYAHEKGLIADDLLISGSGKQVRDVLHADDLISLYKTVYDKKDKINGEIFNIGGGVANSLSLLELFFKLEDILGLNKLSFRCGPVRQSDQKVFIADITKAQRLIGWNPKISSKEGISRMLEWTKNIINNL